MMSCGPVAFDMADNLDDPLGGPINDDVVFKKNIWDNDDDALGGSINDDVVFSNIFDNDDDNRPARRQLQTCESRRQNFLKYCLSAAENSYGCSRECRRCEKEKYCTFGNFHSCKQLCSQVKGKCYLDANNMQC